MKTYFLYFLILIFPSLLCAQKEIYIPVEWQQGSLDYSLARSSASDNFIIFWGPLAGDDPTQAPAEIAFNPQSILDTAEDLYKFYIDTIRFVNDDSGLIHQYKIILVMLHTWTGLEGWAFGGNYDGKVGAMWMHPHAASSGPTLAHEFTHTLQNYAWMMNPGHSFIDSNYVGFFWETHAEFMALQRYPSVALEFDMARWLNTCQFHWSSTRHHYQAFIFLQFIKEKDGIEMINRLWNEAMIGEHPLETYKRLKGITQEELNDLFGEYAMRNVTWDYEIGDQLRERVSTINPVFMSHPTMIPELKDSTEGWYTIPNYLAPQDYGYNIIRLYPQEKAGCTERRVYIHFEPQYIFPDYQEAGLRFGFVALNQLHEPRYSPLYKSHVETDFLLQEDENELYLVVSGAPVNHHNYAWEIGFPRIYRYPYDFKLKNAYPEGFQPGFRDVPAGIPGVPHINGGGFVASTASVESTVYVGPNAQVLDQARISDQVRIEDFAIVQHSAIVEDAAVVSGLAIVGENAHVHGNAVITGRAHVFGGCEVFDSAYIDDHALIFNTQVHENAKLAENTFCWGANLHGDVYLGGDAEFFRECDDGKYLQFESAYNRNCDGLDDHPANIDLTQQFYSGDMQGQYSLTCDGLVENIFEYLHWRMCPGDTFYFYGVPLTMEGFYEKVFTASNGADSIIILDLAFHLNPIIYGHLKICEGDTFVFDGDVYTQEGIYLVDTIDGNGCTISGSISIEWYEVDTSVVRQNDWLVALATASTFQWYDCETDLPVPGANTRTLIPPNDGSYKVEVTDINGCTAYSDCFESTIVSTVEPLQYVVKIQPNPVSDFLELHIESKVMHNMQIEILNMLGQLQSSQPFLKEGLNTRIDVRSLSNGIYMIRLKDEIGRELTRLFTKIE